MATGKIGVYSMACMVKRPEPMKAGATHCKRLPATGDERALQEGSKRLGPSFLTASSSQIALSSAKSHTFLSTICTRSSTKNNMCFDDDRETYTTRVKIRNGHRYTEEYVDPRRAMSLRRRLGLGGTYYPSRYYYRPPSGRYVSGAVVRSNRYSKYAGYPGYSNYAPGYSNYGNYGSSAYYPRGVVSGGYSGYPQSAYDQAGYQRGFVSGGYAGYSSGYGRYQPGAVVAMPRHAAMVSFRSFPFLR